MNTKTPNPIYLQFVNIFFFVLVLIMNAAATTLPLNGKSGEEISNALPSYFTPAGYTFSIWGLIYTALIAFVIYQARPVERKRPFLSKIGWLFTLSSIANSAWIVAWHYGYYSISVVIMLGLLSSLIAIYLRLNIGHPDLAMKWQDKLFYQLPFSLYLGWITVATIANIASVLNYNGWDGFGIAEPVWAMIMIGTAVVVATLLLINRRNAAYTAVLVWAMFGIRASAADSGEQTLATVAVAAAVLLVIITAVGYRRTRIHNTDQSEIGLSAAV
jgi:translocator protein